MTDLRNPPLETERKMTDIVERLRNMADQRHRDRGHDAVDDALREAAAEIERFRSERSYIIGFNDGWEGAHEQQPGDDRPFRSALEASAPVKGETEGYKLVPIEPTPEMVTAGRDVEPLHSTCADVYKAMISTSPEQALVQMVEPVVWVIPGNDNARDNGSVDAMAWQEGEFTRPLYAAPVAPETEGWRPIETAPKDGTPILAYNPVFGVYNTGYVAQEPNESDRFPCGFAGWLGKWHCYPTHWMPLPASPEQGAGQ